MSHFTSQKTIRQYIVLLLVSILIYGYTSTFGYVLDDALYIPDNAFTKEGLSGVVDHLSNEALVGFYGEQKNLLTGGRYRPLAPITYSLEYAVFGLNPGISHFINVLLYGSLLIVLMRVVDRFFPSQRFFSLGFVSALLFAAHPLHVEVVANIKGRDQILALLLVLGSVWVSFGYFKGRKLSILGAGLLFFLGLLAKESTITFLPIIPLAFYFFQQKKIKEILPLFVSLSVFAALWFLLRSWAIQGFQSVESTTLLNDPFIGSTTGEWLGTILFTWLMYQKLLIIPFPLTHDYYPFHISIHQFISPVAIASLLLHSGLAALAIAGFKKRKFYSFLIILYGATFSISSNLFFNIGTFMNERFMFEPSLAFALLIGALVVFKLPQKTGLTVTLLVTVVFGALSFGRSLAWADNYTLFTTDVEVSSNSVKVLTASGGMKLERADTLTQGVLKSELLDESINELSRAVKLMPGHDIPHRLLGKAFYLREGINDGTVTEFLAVLEQHPNDEYVLRHVEYMLANEGDPQARLAFALSFENYMETSFDYNFQLGLLYARQLGDLKNGLKYFQKAEGLQPTNVDLLNNMGVVLAMSGQLDVSNTYLLRALEKDPDNKQALMSLATNYHRLGNESLAQEYLQRANR